MGLVGLVFPHLPYQPYQPYPPYQTYVPKASDASRELGSDRRLCERLLEHLDGLLHVFHRADGDAAM